VPDLVAIAAVAGFSGGVLAETLTGGVPKTAVVALAAVAAAVAILSIWFEWLLPLAVALGAVVAGILLTKATL